MIAVESALAVIGYYELSEEDRPPRNIWHHSERLEEWFAAVKERWRNPNASDDKVDTSNWTSNALADQYR